MFTMRPPLPSASNWRIISRAARCRQKTPLALTRWMRSQSASVRSMMSAKRVTPALLTMTSRRPSSATACTTMRSILATSPQSASIAIARRLLPITPPSLQLAAVRSAAARSISAAATTAPSAAIASAVACPMPAPAPVTSTILSRRTAISISRAVRKGRLRRHRCHGNGHSLSDSAKVPRLSWQLALLRCRPTKPRDGNAMKRGWAAFAVMFAGIFGSTAGVADPMPIRVGWVVTPGHLAPLIEALGKREPRVFKHLGQSYVLQTTRFQGTTPQIQAQAIGDLDVAALSTAALALGITNAKLEERVVADVVADGVEGFYSENYVVAADGPIKTIEDVKGKRIATNAIGSASDAAMRTMFRKHGVKDSDFTTVETNFTNMPAMLDGGKVDLIGTLPQFLKQLRGNPNKYQI